MKPPRPHWATIIVLAVAKFILPFLLQSPVYELHRDEYLYYQQGLHVALGYLENPPLLSYLGTISSWLGGSEFWIKFWPSFIGASTLVTCCLISFELGGKRFAQFLAGLALLTGAYLRMHFLFQPNVLDLFFWTLATYFVIRFIKTEKKYFFYAFAIALAFGVWSKYSIVFFIAAILLAFLLSKHRNIYTKAFLYKAAIVGLLIVLPNIWWQYEHRWPIIHHMQELQETQLRFLSPMDFIKDQLLYLLPVVYVWIAGLVWLFRRSQWRFLGWTYLFVVALLIIGRGKSYYSMGIYPILLAAGAVNLQNWTEQRKWLRAVMIFIVGVLTIPFIPMLLPTWKPEKLAAFYEEAGVKSTGMLRWEDLRDHPLPQDFADMLGWRELSEKAEKFVNSLPDSTKEHSDIYCRSYGQASALRFYGKEKSFRQKVFSDNGSFLLWIPDSVSFQHLIFIGRRMPDKDDEVFQHFQSATIVDSVTNMYSRQFGDKIIFFRNIDSSGLRMARDGLTEMKKEFER